MKSNPREKGKTAIYRPLLHNMLRADFNKKSVRKDHPSMKGHI